MKLPLKLGHLSNEDSAYCCSYIEMCMKLPLKLGHLSNEDSAYCCSYIEMCMKLPLKLGHLSNEDSAYCRSYIEMCTMTPLKLGHLSNHGTWACPKGVLNREVFHCNVLSHYFHKVTYSIWFFYAGSQSGNVTMAPQEVSMATREYCLKYGLLDEQSAPPASNVLDITRLRGLPKLL